jgi:ParB/RepB/Spo0J family partition protein
MAENVTLINPRKIHPNPENPRLIFHQAELEELQQSISAQGILVPLTVFREGGEYCLLDGERRWRCALKLALSSVPIIVQPRPDRMQNLMIMFATHKTRRDWDPLPTALKMQELDDEFFRRYGRRPNEKQLAAIASISRGEVRRLKKLLSLPDRFKRVLLQELQKPRTEQRLTVDQVLETVKGAEALQKRDVIDGTAASQLQVAIVRKFKKNIINSTVDPRKLVRIATAVERGDVKKSMAEKAVQKLIDDDEYTIDDAFSDTVERLDFEHGTRQLAERVLARLRNDVLAGRVVSDNLREVLQDLLNELKRLV